MKTTWKPTGKVTPHNRHTYAAYMVSPVKDVVAPSPLSFTLISSCAYCGWHIATGMYRGAGRNKAHEQCIRAEFSLGTAKPAPRQIWWGTDEVWLGWPIGYYVPAPGCYI